MNQQIVERIQRMDKEKVETQLVLQCAPLIVGLKTSSLFFIYKEQLNQLYFLLEGSQLDCYVLRETVEKAAVFLYNQKRLEHCLAGNRVRHFLAAAGYSRWEPEQVLNRFRVRYQAYAGQEADFPHELGLLLGYPPEDVEGFIRNRGKNFLYTGYWKVYYNVPAKRDLFHMYELSKETLIQLVSNGVALVEIMEAYSGNR
ncbi:MAG: DUF3793 family protein [Lachnospiraceae bacterium]|nr:DUF3793 family protein [Lachnospiraceae bacterium]